MAKYATADIVDKHFDEFQVLSGEVRRYLASIASCGSTIRKMCQLEKKKAQDQLKVIDAEQIKNAQAQIQLTETATQLQTLFRRSAKMRDRQADCLLACVVDPWDEFVRSRMRKLKDLVASHKQTSKSISALCVTVASHRNECLKMFGQLNVQIAQKASKEDEGRHKNKKQSFFSKLGKNATQQQQKVLKAFTRFEEELRSLNELSATSRELRKKMCKILHDVQKVERHCILLVDTQLLHQNRLNIEVSQNFRTVMRQHIPSHKKLVDTRISSLAVFDYETPIHSSEIMEHHDESQTHEHPHYDIPISGLSAKDRRQARRDDKDWRDDASEDRAVVEDLRPSKEFLHRADVADALQSLNASALLTATVMSDYVDPDDDEKLKALFVRHMSRKEKNQSNASSISGFGTPSSNSAAGTPRSGSGASVVSGGGKFSAAKNLFSFTRSRSPSTQLIHVPPKSDHPPEKDRDVNGRQILDGEDPFPDLARSDAGNRLKGPPGGKKALGHSRSASKVSKLTANFERIDAVARSDVKPVLEDVEPLPEPEPEPTQRSEKDEKEEADLDDNGRPILDGASVWDRISSYFSQADYDDDPMADPDGYDDDDEDERDDGPPPPIPTMASDDSSPTPQQSDVRPASMGENSSSRPYPERSQSKSVGIGGFTVEESVSDDEKDADGGFSISSVFGSISRSSKKKKEREVVDLAGILSASEGTPASDPGLNRSRSSSSQNLGYGPCQCGCQNFVRRPFQNGCQECFHIHPKLDAAGGSTRGASSPPSTASPKSKSRNAPLSPAAKAMNASSALTSMGANMLSRIKGAANNAQGRMSRPKTPHPPDSPQSSAPSSPNLNDGFKTPTVMPKHMRTASSKTPTTQSPYSSLSKGSGRNAMSPPVPRSPSTKGKNSQLSGSRPPVTNGTFKSGPDYVQAPGSNRGVRPLSKSNPPPVTGSGNYFARTGSPSPPSSPQMESGNFSSGLGSGKKPPLPAGMKPNPTLVPNPGLGSGTYNSLPKPALPNSPKPQPTLPSSPKPAPTLPSSPKPKPRLAPSSPKQQKPHLAVPGGGSQRRKKMRSSGSIGRFTSRFRKEILVIDDTTLMPDDVPTNSPEETAAALAASRRGPRAM